MSGKNIARVSRISIPHDLKFPVQLFPFLLSNFLTAWNYFLINDNFPNVLENPANCKAEALTFSSGTNQIGLMTIILFVLKLIYLKIASF
jgi:hypothetical protein